MNSPKPPELPYVKGEFPYLSMFSYVFHAFSSCFSDERFYAILRLKFPWSPELRGKLAFWYLRPRGSAADVRNSVMEVLLDVEIRHVRLGSLPRHDQIWICRKQIPLERLVSRADAALAYFIDARQFDMSLARLCIETW